MTKPTVSLQGARFFDFDTCSRPDQEDVVFLSRDPGSWNAVRAVIDRVSGRRSLHPYLLASGWTAEHLERCPHPTGRPIDGLFPSDVLGSRKPAVFVTACGESDNHLEIAARELFPDVPMLCVEDNYGAYVRLFRELARRELALPETVCCIDRESRHDLADAFPTYSAAGGARGVITGQPAFGGLVTFGGADRKAHLRRRIGVETSASLVTFMGATDSLALLGALTAALAARDCRGVVYAFVPHPRDTTWPGLYVECFDRAGLELIETVDATTDDLAAASDLIVSTWSTELTRAAYRGIPALYVVDRHYVDPGDGRFPMPPVRLGAAVQADTVEDAAHFVQMLADTEHHSASLDIADRIRRNQARHYQSHRRDAVEAVLDEIGRLA